VRGGEADEGEEMVARGFDDEEAFFDVELLLGEKAGLAALKMPRSTVWPMPSRLVVE
jgi:hypothetical protein